MQQRSSRSFLIVGCVLLLCLVAFALRWFRLEQKSLTNDEVFTVAATQGVVLDNRLIASRGEWFDAQDPVSPAYYSQKVFRGHIPDYAETAKILATDDFHPPLYFWITDAWLQNQPDALTNIGLLRLPAVLSGVLSVLLMFWVGWSLGGWETGLLVAAMMALSGFQMQLSQNARPYSLELLLALAAAGSQFSLFQIASTRLNGKKLGLWLLWIITVALGLYTQYLFVIFVSFLILAAILQQGRNRTLLLQMGVALVLVGVICLPWQPYFLSQMAFSKQITTYIDGLWRWQVLPEKIYRFITDSLIAGFMPGKIFLGVLWLGLAIQLFRLRPNQLSPYFRIGLLWVLVMVLGQIALDLITHKHSTMYDRYLILATPGIYLLIAGLLLRTPWQAPRLRLKLKPVLTGGLLVLMLWGAIAKSLEKPYLIDDYRGPALWLNQNLQSRDLILVTRSESIAVALAYYLKPEARMTGIDRVVPARAGCTFAQCASSKIARISQNIDRIWLVVSHQSKPNVQLIKTDLQANGFQEAQKLKFQGVTVSRFIRQ